MVKININEAEYEFIRPRLKKWLALEDLRVLLRQAITNSDPDGVAEHVISIVSQSLGVHEEEIKERPWYELGTALFVIEKHNHPKYEFPLLTAKLRENKETWDYDGRTWYIWTFLFAKRFGWSLEYIAELDVDDAIALAQEIAVDDQLQHEWEWMLSEVPYNSKEGFKALPRPTWMLYSGKPKPIKLIKIRKDFLPHGLVVRYDTTETK